MGRVVVYHANYGCETGCCGHYVELDGERVDDSFRFDHPWDNTPEKRLEFAKNLIIDEFGKEHCHDLDWESCVIDEW